MAEHRTQLGLPAREDYIFVAKALSQGKGGKGRGEKRRSIQKWKGLEGGDEDRGRPTQDRSQL